MNTPSTQPLYESMSSEEQTAYIASVNEYVNTTLPQLVAAGRAVNAEHIDNFRNGLTLLSAFPQYKMFAITAFGTRSDYDQYIATMAYQFNNLVQHMSDLMTVRTPEGQRVVVLQQTQTLRRGRPTQAESEQRKREEQAAAKAAAVAELTGAAISTQEAAPVEERESDTSRRKKDEEPSLFSAAVQAELSAPSDFDPSDPSPIQTITPNSSEAPLTSLRDWMHILPENLASQVRDLRNVRAEMASESEKAKLILEQGGTIADMQEHTQRAKDLDRQINDLYAEIDEYLGCMYIMLTEVNPEWDKLAAKHMKQTGEPIEKLCARLKPYATKMNEKQGWMDATLEACRKEAAARVAADTRDPEKEKEMHKMDAYIRRKDVNASQKRLDTMRQYRDKLAEMGADADSLAAYDVFIAAVEKEVAAKQHE